MITNVQLFQLLHGLTSQRGVYDNRAYAGKLSQYRFDATLAGIDASSVGAAGSSAAGLEDCIAFHSKVAPTAFEIGHYGIDDGTDNHSVGKPSDGVHLSIEDHWQTAPFSTRQGTDNFAPANRWVAGGQRWALGNLAAGQSANFDILLSLLTGTKGITTAGNHTGGSCNGGSSHAGGVDFVFDDATSAGTFFGEFSKADGIEMGEREIEGQFALPTFATPGGTMTQLWNLTQRHSLGKAHGHRGRGEPQDHRRDDEALAVRARYRDERRRAGSCVRRHCDRRRHLQHRRQRDAHSGSAAGLLVFGMDRGRKCGEHFDSRSPIRSARCAAHLPSPAPASWAG